MMNLISKAGGYLLQPSRYQFGVLNSANVGRDAEVLLIPPRTLFSKNIQSSTTPSTPSSSAQEERVSVQLSGWSSKDSKLPASRNSSRQDRIPSLLREASTLPSVTCILTTGDGTPTIPSREATGSATKTLSTICAKKPQKLSWNFSHTDCPSQEPKRVKFTREPSEVNPESTAKVKK